MMASKRHRAQVARRSLSIVQSHSKTSRQVGKGRAVRSTEPVASAPLDGTRSLAPTLLGGDDFNTPMSTEAARVRGARVLRAGRGALPTPPGATGGTTATTGPASAVAGAGAGAWAPSPPPSPTPSPEAPLEVEPGVDSPESEPEPELEPELGPGSDPTLGFGASLSPLGVAPESTEALAGGRVAPLLLGSLLLVSIDRRGSLSGSAFTA